MNPPGKGITMYAQDILEHQSEIEDIILQGWIAAQALALEAPAFQPK
jgi:hypothetical protein